MVKNPSRAQAKDSKLLEFESVEEKHRSSSKSGSELSTTDTVVKKRRMTRENAKKLVKKTGSGMKRVGAGAKRVGAGAKAAMIMTGSGAKRVGSGAKRIATAPGRKVKDKMVNLNDRMEAVEWTPKVMMKEYFKFNMVGIFNVSVFFLIYEILYWINIWDAHRAVGAWIVGTLISQVLSHLTHYRITFGSSAPYSQSLKWAMIVYTIALAFSASSEYYLIEIMLINHRYAWAINTCLFGFLNFAILRWLAFPPELDKSYLADNEE